MDIGALIGGVVDALKAGGDRAIEMLLLLGLVYQSWRIVRREDRDEENRVQAAKEANARTEAFTRIASAMEGMERGLSDQSQSIARIEGCLSVRSS